MGTHFWWLWRLEFQGGGLAGPGSQMGSCDGERSAYPCPFSELTCTIVMTPPSRPSPP